MLKKNKCVSALASAVGSTLSAAMVTNSAACGHKPCLEPDIILIGYQLWLKL